MPRSCSEAHHGESATRITRGGALCPQPPNGGRRDRGAAWSRARFEDCVNLGAILENFPGAGKARGHDKSIAGSERSALARLAFNHNAPRGDHTQLILGIAHAPLAACSRPATGEKFLTRVGSNSTRDARVCPRPGGQAAARRRPARCHRAGVRWKRPYGAILARNPAAGFPARRASLHVLLGPSLLVTAGNLLRARTLEPHSDATVERVPIQVARRAG